MREDRGGGVKSKPMSFPVERGRGGGVISNFVYSIVVFPRSEPVGLPSKSKCNLQIVVSNAYMCETCRITDCPTALKFNRTPLLVIIYIPT